MRSGIVDTMALMTLLVAIAATTLAYLPGLTAFFVADDFMHMYGHLHAPPLRFLTTNWLGKAGDGGMYRPIFNIVHAWLPHHFGLTPEPYHVFEYLIHALVCFFLYRVAHQLTGSRISSAIGVLLFASHRINAWAVVWIHAGPPIAGLLYLITLSWLLGNSPGNKSTRSLMIYGALVFLSLLAGEGAIPLPFIGWALVFCSEHESGFRKRFGNSLNIIWPGFIALVVYIVIRIKVLGGIGGYFGTHLSPNITLRAIVDYAIQWRNLWVPPGLSLPQLTWAHGRLWNYIPAVLVWITVLGPLIILYASLPRNKRILILGPLFWSIAAPGFTLGMGPAMWRLYYSGMGWSVLIAVVISSWQAVNRKVGTAAFALPVSGLIFYWILHLSGFSHDLYEFKKAGAITRAIISDTMRYLPHPPKNEVICYEGVPGGLSSGAPVFVFGLQEALRIAYGNENVTARIEPGCGMGTDSSPYRFRYHDARLEPLEGTTDIIYP